MERNLEWDISEIEKEILRELLKKSLEKEITMERLHIKRLSARSWNQAKLK